MLLISVPAPNPITAPISRFDNVKRKASAAPRSNDTAARPPHIAAVQTLMTRLSPAARLAAAESRCRSSRCPE
jgi:hypothetical protein